jgi:predicted metalloprotease with PDZ domain
VEVSYILYMTMRRRIAPIFIAQALAAVVSPLPARAQADSPSITLSVDAREAPRKILHATESIRVSGGAVTLAYPEWIPGEHGPTGPVVDVAGLHITSGGQTVVWRRDQVDMFAIHCDAPAGAGALDLRFDFLLPPQASGFSSGSSASDQLVIVSWNQVIFSPKDLKSDDVAVSASLQIPTGWKYGTALEPDHESGGTISFKTVSLTDLIDSPVLAGLHFRKVDISAGTGVPHFLNIASDDDAPLRISREQIAKHERLVLEAFALFGAHHYNHYDFLYTLSDQVAHFGLEHHQSSDDRVAEYTLLDSSLWKVASGLLPHEFVHSWNGKFRRPAGLATGDYTTPMKGELLWVYEGLTQYLGKILAPRCGLRSPEDYREDLALLAARLDNRPGREWRPLQDAADEAQLLYGARADWEGYRRSTDFYDESDLIWLEADVTIRAQTKGKKSLDDFCRLFHGGATSGPLVKPYTFEDVAGALNEIAPYDWKNFLSTRLQSTSAHAPLGGIEAAGWKIVYRATPHSYERAEEVARKFTDLRFSLGVTVTDDGAIMDVLPNSPAAQAGLAPGMKLVAVDDRKFSKQLLHEAIQDHAVDPSAIRLLAMNGDYFKTYSVGYHGGERYPHLERDAAKPDVLSEIIKPRAEKREKK